MLYRETRARPPISEYVDSIWAFTLEESDDDIVDHVVVPDGAVSLSYVQLPGKPAALVATCPSLQAFETKILKGAVYAGIRLRPGVAGSVLKQDIQQLVGGRPLLLDDAIPGWARQTRERTRGAPGFGQITDILSECAQRVPAVCGPVFEDVVGLAGRIAEANGSGSISRLASRSDYSPRQLRRRFLRQVGISPKEFARLRRVRFACTQLVLAENQSLGGTSLDSGFSDQSHFSREIKQIFGSSSKLVLRYLRQIKHQGMPHR